MEKEITICSNHRYYQVPLIWTFRHHGAEFWCPFCGEQSGMLGAGVDVENNEVLNQRSIDYNEKASKYLSAETNEWEYDKEIENKD